MKKLLVFSFIAALVVCLNACTKNAVDPTSATASARTAGVTSTSATGPRSLTAVDVATLPASITTYITTTYTGATVKEAFNDKQGNYVVAITVGSSVKLLLFNASGTFVKAVDGKRGHAPGDSAHHVRRDSLRHTRGDSTHHAPGDTLHRPRPGKGTSLTIVAASSLPAAITAYINTNYAGATINKAAQEATTNNYIVYITTADNKRVVLVFGSDGTFKRAVKGNK
ncbi:PepSY-like domain-containing protein [Spirosoma fluviale]|uniref:Beta-lactamase-inhibitor-like, PepSY-like n=1 Tax=Spirosoma fluviale TaxID=1597977 RepID=A0A286F3Y5_9BACT|nr:PepSY-like domain-containing protein [Spirosoma fluviale]SOD77940.1 Putative beta-lactamase-inhibitor-like, PepSY-like [Spirosoma fluviale]